MKLFIWSSDGKEYHIGPKEKAPKNVNPAPLSDLTTVNLDKHVKALEKQGCTVVVEH